MAATAAVLWRDTPGTSNGTSYTSAADGTLLTGLILSNVTAFAATVTLAYDGSSATDSKKFLPAVTVPPNDTVFVPMYLPIANTKTIQSQQGTSNAVNVIGVGTTP